MCVCVCVYVCVQSVKILQNTNGITLYRSTEWMGFAYYVSSA